MTEKRILWAVVGVLTMGLSHGIGAQESAIEGAGDGQLEALTAAWRAEHGELEPESERRILRALLEFAALEQHPEAVREEVLVLTRSANPNLRVAAYGALGCLAPREVPLRELWGRVLDPALADEERVLAFRAWSRGPAPEVSVRLHSMAVNVDHPAWGEVMDLLGERGDGFTLHHLSSLGMDLDAARRAAQRGMLERVRSDLSARQGAHKVRELLERAAWADLQCHPLEVEVVSWTLESITNWTADEAVVHVLQDLYRNYEPSPDVLSPTLGSGLQSRVREYAHRLLPD